jgi:predicted DNA-binding transcriptional regulator AlpA
MFGQLSTNEENLLTEIRAAEVVSLSVKTLQAWRLRGVGPAYVKAGKAVRYRRADLLAWIEAHTISPEGVAVPSKREGAR